jgi:hypothetical protein
MRGQRHGLDLEQGADMEDLHQLLHLPGDVLR